MRMLTPTRAFLDHGLRQLKWQAGAGSNVARHTGNAKAIGAVALDREIEHDVWLESFTEILSQR